MQAEATFYPDSAESWSYPVLAMVSLRYPGPEGRLPTCYSPVRHFTRSPKTPFSFDLHVLSTPPAFVLSQDQTLQLNPWRSAPDPRVECPAFSLFGIPSSPPLSRWIARPRDSHSLLLLFRFQGSSLPGGERLRRDSSPGTGTCISARGAPAKPIFPAPCGMASQPFPARRCVVSGSPQRATR